MSAAGIDLYPVTERVAAKVADRSSGVGARGAAGGDPGQPRVRPVLHRPHGRVGLDRGRRVGDARARRRTRPCRSTRRPWSSTTGSRSSRGSRPTGRRTARSNGFRPDANAARFAARARRLAMPELPEDLFLGSVEALVRADRLGARGPGAEPVPAAVHVRHRDRPGRAPGQRVHVPARRLAGRRVLPARGEARHRLAVDRVRPRRPRRHRRGQVRRQLRRVADRPGARRRAGLRPGRLARRGRAPLGRGDGRDEPRLRLGTGDRRDWSPRR